MLASGGIHGELKLWDVCSGRLQAALPVDAGPPIGPKVFVTFSSDGKTLVCGCERLFRRGKRCQALGRASCREREQAAGVVARSYAGCGLCAGGQLLAATVESGNVHLWDAAAGKLLATLPGVPTYVNAVALSADGRSLAAASNDGP